MRAYGHARTRLVGNGLFERLHRLEQRGHSAVHSVEEALGPRIDACQLPERVTPVEAETGQRAGVRECLELGTAKPRAGDEIGERGKRRTTALNFDTSTRLFA